MLTNLINEHYEKIVVLKRLNVLHTFNNLETIKSKKLIGNAELIKRTK